MREKLEKLKNNLIAFYRNSQDTCRFIVGYILGIDDNGILVDSIDEGGNHDGVMYLDIKSVYMIEIDNNYLNKLEKKIYDNINYKINNVKNLMNDLFDYSMKNNYIVSIEMMLSNNEDAVGYIKNYNDEVVNINCYNEKGKYDGKSILKKSNVTLISCNSHDEKELEMLINKD